MIHIASRMFRIDLRWIFVDLAGGSLWFFSQPVFLDEYGMGNEELLPMNCKAAAFAHSFWESSSLHFWLAGRLVAIDVMYALPSLSSTSNGKSTSRLLSSSKLTKVFFIASLMSVIKAWFFCISNARWAVCRRVLKEKIQGCKEFMLSKCFQPSLHFWNCCCISQLKSATETIRHETILSK